MTKTKRKLPKPVLFALSILRGMAAGLMIGVAAMLVAHQKGLAERYSLIHFYLSFFLGAFTQIVLHEAGHLVFGLMTGYRFVSFRVGSLMLLRANGRMRLRRYKLPGTIGQCLMAPPAPYAPHDRAQLYNYGGVLMNIMASLAAVPIIVWANGMIAVYAAAFSVIGLLFALLNGIPMRGFVSNDGANARALRAGEKARFALWLQLTANHMLAEGTRLRDLPEAWFEETDFEDSLTLSYAYIRAQRLMDMEQFDEALSAQNALAARAKSISPLLHFFIQNDLVYLYLTATPPDTAAAQAIMNKSFQTLSKKMAVLPQVQRTRYACALAFAPEHVEKEEKKLAALLLRSPYPGETEGEAMLKKRAEALIKK